MRRIDFGIASYENPDMLAQTLQHLISNSVSDWRCLVVDNLSPDPRVREIISEYAANHPQIIPKFMEENTGYAGAVNEILNWAETDYIVYVDNDAHVKTHGWDELMAGYLDRAHELGMVFSSKWGAYEIPRTNYVEVLWSIGCFWMLKRLAMADVGLFDESLGHQEEVDFQTRLRLKGWKFATVKEVDVQHFANASSSPAAQERIGQGVVRWMNKWEEYFCGKGMSYHSPNVLRFEDWPINAIYLEEWYSQRLPGLNADPEVVNIGGREYDLIKVPRFRNYYRNRII